MNTAVRDAWAAELAVDRGQEWEDTQVARSVMDRRLIQMSYHNAELARELEKYPKRPGSNGRDVPISPDGQLPPRLAKLMKAAVDETIRQSVPGPRFVPGVVESQGLIGTSQEWQVHRLAARIFQERLEAPVRMPKVRKVQAELDAMFEPDPAPQDARPWSAWGQL